MDMASNVEIKYTGIYIPNQAHLLSKSQIHKGLSYFHGIWILSGIKKGKNVKSSMAKSLPVENLLPQNVGSIINYLQ